MANRTGILFLNPRSGTFSAGDEASLRALAEEHGLRVVEVGRDVDVPRLVQEALQTGLRSFVVAGGDGTIHHVAQGLVGTEGILGLVPAGSVNHLARDLGLPVNDWRAAFEIAVRGSVRQIDVGRINDQYFLNSVMLGFTPAVTEYREKLRPTHSRWHAYLKAIRMALHVFPHVTLVVESDGRVEPLRTQMFVVSVNAYDLSSLGPVSTKKSFNDGRLAMYSLTFMSRIQFIGALAKYLRGRIDDVPGFRSSRTTRVRLDTGRRKLRVAVDGEFIELATPLQIISVPASLLVRAPTGD